ncbi:hypothetical protein [Bacillus phage FI_KG-Lek]|nr:hypothetical protein [Bacillus phage FI_KG-Lek]
MELGRGEHVKIVDSVKKFFNFEKTPNVAGNRVE